MKYTRQLSFAVLSVFICSTQLFSQTDKERIEILRTASNLALKTYDNPKVLSFLTENVLIATGAGALLSGRATLAQYISGGGESKMYWTRIPQEIEVNKKMGWPGKVELGVDSTPQ